MHRFDNQLLSVVSVESALRVSWRKKEARRRESQLWFAKREIKFQPLEENSEK